MCLRGAQKKLERGKLIMTKKWYLVLDTETATLPFSDDISENAKEKQRIAIAKPLVYDLGYVIVDRNGNRKVSRNFLIQETFFVPNVFNTAYYKNKRPMYMEKLKNGEIEVATWERAISTLIQDLESVDIVCAYNATFDFKKAIPFTERYIKALYSDSYNEWEQEQYRKCLAIAKGNDKSKNEKFLEPTFELRNREYPVLDLWSLACERLVNTKSYKNFCFENKLFTNSGTYFKTSAETVFQYVTGNADFVEEHAALADAEIESEILVKCLRRGKVEPKIKSFPFNFLGKTLDNAETYADYKALYEVMKNYFDNSTINNCPYWINYENTLNAMKMHLDTKPIEKKLIFDMDGTIANFYGVDNWLECLKNSDATPYKIAKPLVDFEEFNSLLRQLQTAGFKIVITSWLAKNASKEFDKKVRQAKKAWLEKYGMPVDEIHLVKYGTPKQKCSKADIQILFDDNAEVRNSFENSRQGRSVVDVTTTDICDYLKRLF